MMTKETNLIDTLLTGGTIITMNPERWVLHDAAVAVKEGKILWIGDASEAKSRFTAGNRVDLQGRVVIPGLVNTHGHWAMTLMRGLVDDCPLEQWLGTIWRVEAAVLSPETVVTGSELAIIEMLRAGTTCAADMYWYYPEVTETSRRAGFRIVTGPSFAEIEGFEDYRHTNQMIAIEYLDNYADVPLVRPCIQAHSAYTTSPTTLEHVMGLVHDRGLLFVTHASESKGELELVQEKHGARPIAVLDKFGLLSERTLLAHCVHLTDEEIGRLAETGTSVAHCPSSNLKLSSGIARVAELLAQGVNVSIGTDGPASNNDLDLFHEAQLAALVQKGVTGNPKVLPAEKVFSMLTIDGARAVGLDDIIGSLEVGKSADLVVIDFSSANLTPCYDYYSHLIYALSIGDVRDAMVAGQMLMKDRQMLTLDEAATRAEANRIAREVL
ncbi:MAG: amidohydrolase family protein [Anaerolineaceae bacterium]